MCGFGIHVLVIVVLVADAVDGGERAARCDLLLVHRIDARDRGRVQHLIGDLLDVLEVEAGFEVVLEDERLSSEYAKKVMIEQNIKTGKNKELVDLTAASIILQTYLDRSKHL